MGTVALTNDQRATVEANIPLAEQITNKAAYKWPRAERDGIHAAALYGLTLAGRRFQGNRGASFKTYATKCVWGEISEYVSGAAKLKFSTTQIAADYSGYMDGGDGKWIDTMIEPAAPLVPLRLDGEAEWDHLLHRVRNERLRRVVRMYADDRMTMGEIAAHEGLCVSRIQQLLHEARSILGRTTFAHVTPHPRFARSPKHFPNPTSGNKRAIVSSTGRRFDTITEAARSVGRHRNTLYRCVAENRPCGGVTWQYEEGVAA